MSFEEDVNRIVTARLDMGYEIVTPMQIFRLMREYYEPVPVDEMLARIEAEVDKQMRTMCRVNNSVRCALLCSKGTITTSSGTRVVGYFALDVSLDGCLDLLISAYEEDGWTL